MTARADQALRGRWRPLSDLVGWLTYRLQRWVAAREPGMALEPLEGAVQTALRPVEPSDRFRENLRDNLSFAARGKMAGLVVEHPRPFREGIVLGISAGLLVATIATLVLVFRSRLAGTGR